MNRVSNRAAKLSGSALLAGLCDENYTQERCYFIFFTANIIVTITNAPLRLSVFSDCSAIMPFPLGDLLLWGIIYRDSIGSGDLQPGFPIETLYLIPTEPDFKEGSPNIHRLIKIYSYSLVKMTSTYHPCKLIYRNNLVAISL